MFLNVIRFTACEMVVLGHFLTKYQPTPTLPSFTFGSTIGGTAVLLFFILSGLLICYSLKSKLQHPAYRFRSFFVERFSRIYSSLVPALLIGAVIVVFIYTTNPVYFESLCTMQSMPSPLTFGLTLGMLDRFPASVFGWHLPFPSVTPFGFNGILWTLVVEWWIYMFFGWLVIGSLGFIGKRQRGGFYKIIFVVAAAFLSLVLATLFQEYSSLIIVWVAGAALMLVISSGAVRTKLSGILPRRALGSLFVVSLATALYAVYLTFVWTHNYYDVNLGLLLLAFVFLGVLFLNGNSVKQASKWVNSRVIGWVAVGAGFSYTLFLTHYPIIIFLNGLNLPINRYYMLIPILFITNATAFIVAHFTEKKHRQLSTSIKRLLHIPPC